jgi:hypothetical protein
MDESVELFKAEQKRFKDAGGSGAYLGQALVSSALRLLVFGLAAYGVMSFVDLFPRNPDNSVKLAVFGPVTATLAVIATLVLKIGKPTAQAIRWTCWGFIAVALVSIPAGFVDLLARNGS